MAIVHAAPAQLAQSASAAPCPAEPGPPGASILEVTNAGEWQQKIAEAPTEQTITSEICRAGFATSEEVTAQVHTAGEAAAGSAQLQEHLAAAMGQESCAVAGLGEQTSSEVKRCEMSSAPAQEAAAAGVGPFCPETAARAPESAAPEAAAPASEEEASDGERSDAERSDRSDSDESDNESEPSDEEILGEPVAKEEISTLAGVEEPVAAGPEVPPPLSLPPSTYPHQNLPPRTGISIPMLATSPIFLRTVPAAPEPFYIAPEALFDDIVRQEADRISRPELVRNLIVYDSVDVRDPESLRSAGPPREPLRPGPTDVLPPYYEPAGPDDSTLVFESRFESGNLRRAVQVYDFEYDLILNPDYNTKVHTQWYFFRVSNTRKGQEYRLNIINMVKPTSVYNEGMRPLLYSVKEAEMNNVGWVRGSENIAYYQNGIRRKDRGTSGDKGMHYFTLTFTVSFQHDADTVYFSHCYPYTYTDLQKDLQAFEANPAASRMFRRRKLCETLAGNACDLITITSFNSEPAALRSRRSVVITARVHPGESNASWIMKGMLDYLTGSSLDARILRDNFVFKIIPMLNPDGVIVGNYRCSLAGTDLNRQWGDPSRKLHPTVFFAKSMMRHLIDDRDVILYIDIHGHSRKKNVFMYGNSESASIREKIFPRLLSKSSDCFCFDDCCFKIQKSKESTARVVAYRELAILNSFTLEASFCGADFGALAEQHFTTRHLEEMGYMVCDAILDFCDPDQSKVMSVSTELQVLFPEDGNSDDVSDSEVDEAAVSRMRRKKIRKSRKEKEKSKKKRSVIREPKVKTNEDLTPLDGFGDGADGDWHRKLSKRESWSTLDATGGCTDNVVGGRRGNSNNEVTESRGKRGGGDNRSNAKKKRNKEKEKSSEKRTRDREPSTAVVVASATATIAAATAAAVAGSSSSAATVAGGAGGAGNAAASSSAGTAAASSGSQNATSSSQRSAKNSTEFQRQARKGTDSEPLSPAEPHGEGSSSSGPARKKGGNRESSGATGGYNPQAEVAQGEASLKSSVAVPMNPPNPSRRPKVETRV